MDDWTGWTLTMTGVTPEPGTLCRLRYRDRGGAMVPDESIKQLTARYQVTGWEYGSGGGVLNTSAIEVLAWQPAVSASAQRYTGPLPTPPPPARR